MRDRPAWHYIQSGVIPFQSRKKGIRILLITSRKKGRWIIPKGIVEPGHSPTESAAMEALEEAGIRGEVIRTAIGTYRTKKWGARVTVTLYPMRVTKTLKVWPEMKIRDRQWMSLAKATDAIGVAALRTVLEEFEDRLAETQRGR